MLSFLVRLTGLVLFAVGVVTLIADGIRSIAVGHLELTSLGHTWAAIDAGSLDAAGRWLGARAPDVAAAVAGGSLLELPTLAVAGVLGIVLMLIGQRRAGRRRRPLI